jgi:hypothetical protein
LVELKSAVDDETNDRAPDEEIGNSEHFQEELDEDIGNDSE